MERDMTNFQFKTKIKGFNNSKTLVVSWNFEDKAVEILPLTKMKQSEEVVKVNGK